MDLILYPKLSTCSKRAIVKTKGRFGRKYEYVPRGHLLDRLSQETGWTTGRVWNQLMLERKELLKKLSL